MAPLPARSVLGGCEYLVGAARTSARGGTRTHTGYYPHRLLGPTRIPDFATRARIPMLPGAPSDPRAMAQRDLARREQDPPEAGVRDGTLRDLAGLARAREREHASTEA